MDSERDVEEGEVHIALIQESKLKEVNEEVVKEVCGSRFIRWVAVEAVGTTRRNYTNVGLK